MGLPVQSSLPIQNQNHAGFQASFQLSDVWTWQQPVRADHDWPAQLLAAILEFVVQSIDDIRKQLLPGLLKQRLNRVYGFPIAINESWLVAQVITHTHELVPILGHVFCRYKAVHSLNNERFFP